MRSVGHPFSTLLARFIRVRQAAHAVLRRLLVIGEAAARLTPETQSRFENLPFRKMAGMRNRVVHDYGEIDFEIIWETVTCHLPQVLTEIGEFLSAARR
jgi:uncharacterized protein with HEPN domain